MNFKEKALSQNEAITRYFLQRKGKEFSPSQILDRVFGQSTPLTSVRRSITVLTKRGILKQTGNQITGIYGRNENTWTYK